jgi:hypothetical protein
MEELMLGRFGAYASINEVQMENLLVMDGPWHLLDRRDKAMNSHDYSPYW